MIQSALCFNCCVLSQTITTYLTYRCWQKTGLEGNFVQDFVATWEARAKPVANTWAAAHEQWIKSITNFEGEA